nr:DUF4160 domain-containing protein [Nitrosospira sp. Nsp13]
MNVYGIIIQIFWDDHAPLHFHANYAQDEVLIDIRTLRVLEKKCHGERSY